MVSGLVLNFVPDPAQAVHEVARVSRADGRVAAYVWDYAGGMEFVAGQGSAPRLRDVAGGAAAGDPAGGASEAAAGRSRRVHPAGRPGLGGRRHMS